MRTNEQALTPIHRNYSKLLISESPLQVLPTLAVKIGLNEALMLQQVHYWISNPMNQNVRSGRVWVYKTHAEWKKEFPFWSIMTIRRTIESLESKGLLLSNSNFNKMYSDRTKWYSIDYDKLDLLHNSLEIGTSVQNEHMGCSKRTDGLFKMNTSVPETTPEITTKNNNKPKVVRCAMATPKKLHVKPRAIVEPKPKPSPKPKAEPTQQPKLKPVDFVVVNSEIDDLINKVQGWAISRVLLDSWVKKHGVEYILQKIELTKSAKAKNPGAYLNKAIANDWLPPAPKEDEKASNLSVETIYPSHDENVAWYNKLSENEKLAVLSKATYKQGYFEKHLKNANVSVLDADFTENCFFKMMMELIGRAL